ncbi:MAG TPA: hypothetical protein PKX92_05820 [Edaphocola sp.]|nr:hypothetical protein [Edaphocola sp.]
MRLFGFIKENDSVEGSISIKDLIQEGGIESPYRKEVIDYLEKGKLCVPWMGCIEDANDPLFDTDDYENDDFVAYYAIYTDGHWIWPQYIIEYLKKYPTMKIDTKFIQYVIGRRGKEIEIPDEDVLSMEKKYMTKFT